MGNRILGQDCDAIRIDQLRQTMVDLRINMIGTSGQDDAHPIVLFTETDGRLALLLQILLYAFIFFKTGV